jgi:hypothetical protein
MAVRLQRAARAKVAPEIEREILRLAIEQPAFGQDRVACELRVRRIVSGPASDTRVAAGSCGWAGFYAASPRCIRPRRLRQLSRFALEGDRFRSLADRKFLLAKRRSSSRSPRLARCRRSLQLLLSESTIFPRRA